MEIPLKLKYRIRKPVKMNKSRHDDGNRKRPGYAKHKNAPKGWKGEALHVQYVMVLQVNGKTRFMPLSEWERLNGAEA